MSPGRSASPASLAFSSPSSWCSTAGFTPGRSASWIGTSCVIGRPRSSNSNVSRPWGGWPAAWPTNTRTYSWGSRAARALARDRNRGGRISTAVRKYIDEIHSAATRGTSLATRLLSFSRRQAADLLAVEVDASLANVERLLRGLLGEDVNLVVECAAPGAFVVAGEGWLEQVLLNLAVNARDAMPSGRSPVRSEQRCERGHGEIRRCTYSWKTRGPEWTPRPESASSSPFTRPSRCNWARGWGSPLSHGLVQQMGGRIEFQSEPGQGTTFVVILPRTTDSTAARDRQPEQEPVVPVEPATVLVVEDERLVLLTVDHYLRRAGYLTILSRDPTEALRLCREREDKIDLLLTDVSLPHMGGRELAEEVRSLYPGIPVLFMSAFTREQPPGREQDRTGGANDREALYGGRSCASSRGGHGWSRVAPSRRPRVPSVLLVGCFQLELGDPVPNLVSREPQGAWRRASGCRVLARAPER